MTQAATLTLLRKISEDYKSDSDQMYDVSITLLQYAAVQKNIEF